jgi:hypothetical protein
VKKAVSGPGATERDPESDGIIIATLLVIATVAYGSFPHRHLDALARRQRDVLTGRGAGVVHGVGLKLASFGSRRNDVLV